MPRAPTSLWRSVAFAFRPWLGFGQFALLTVAREDIDLFIIALPNEDWVVGKGTKGPLALSATIKVPPPGGTSHDWSGQITVPSVTLTP